MNQHKRLIILVSVLGLSLLACQPVFAIGWQEVLFVFALLAFLIGPPLYNLYRRWEKFKSDLKPKNKK
jgi:hypothetical protein